MDQMMVEAMAEVSLPDSAMDMIEATVTMRTVASTIQAKMAIDRILHIDGLIGPNVAILGLRAAASPAIAS